MEDSIALKETFSPYYMLSTNQRAPCSLGLCSKGTHIPE